MIHPNHCMFASMNAPARHRTARFRPALSSALHNAKPKIEPMLFERFLPLDLKGLVRKLVNGCVLRDIRGFLLTVAAAHCRLPFAFTAMPRGEPNTTERAQRRIYIFSLHFSYILTSGSAGHSRA